MATYDYTLNSTTFPLGGTPTPRINGIGKLTSRVIDVAARAAAANVYDLFDVPKGLVILSCQLTVLQPANAALSIDVGVTGVDVDCYADGCDMTAAAGTVYNMPAGTEASFVGALGGNANAAIILVSALQSAATVYTAGKFVVTLTVAGVN